MPPVTVIGPLLNATPTSPTVVVPQVTDSAGLMVMLQDVLLAPFASVTFTVNVPDAVAVPVIAPVLVFRLSPAGSVPTIE